MRQHIGRNGANQGFAGHDYRLVGGFEGGAKALPLAGGFGGGGGDVNTPLTSLPRTCFV